MEKFKFFVMILRCTSSQLYLYLKFDTVLTPVQSRRCTCSQSWPFCISWLMQQYFSIYNTVVIIIGSTFYWFQSNIFTIVSEDTPFPQFRFWFVIWIFSYNEQFHVSVLLSVSMNDGNAVLYLKLYYLEAESSSVFWLFYETAPTFFLLFHILFLFSQDTMHILNMKIPTLKALQL